MSDQENASKLAHLGKQSAQPQTPDEAVLEAVPYKHPDRMPGKAVMRYICPEFTSLCPATGQPDFAHITIDYVPDRLLVESKSLKLFMSSFRNHRAFHETTTMLVATRFAACCVPTWLRVVGLWYPRGGIPIDVFWQSGEPPTGALIPEIDYKHYRGR